MQSLTPTHTFVVDMLTYADRINSTHASQFLIAPPTGMYLRGRSEPTLVPMQTYYQRLITGTAKNKKEKMVPINIWEKISGDIYNQVSEIVVAGHQTHYLSREPTVPVIALQIIEIIAKRVVDDLSKFWIRMDNPRLRFESTRKEDDFYKPEILLRPFFIDNLSAHQYQESVDEIMEEVSLLKREISQFIGSDKWIMHFVRRRGSSLIVEKTIDYRIYAWERDHADDLPDEHIQIRNAIEHDLSTDEHHRKSQ